MRAVVKIDKGATVFKPFQRDKKARFNDVQLHYNLSLGRVQPILLKITLRFIMFQATEQINVYIKEIQSVFEHYFTVFR